jgi:hypothetical protein
VVHECVHIGILKKFCTKTPFDTFLSSSPDSPKIETTHRLYYDRRGGRSGPSHPRTESLSHDVYLLSQPDSLSIQEGCPARAASNISETALGSLSRMTPIGVCPPRSGCGPFIQIRTSSLDPRNRESIVMLRATRNRCSAVSERRPQFRTLSKTLPSRREHLVRLALNWR